MAQRMHDEPNVDMQDCRGEGHACFNMALCGGGYSRRGYPADENVALFKWGRFVTTVSHDGRLPWLGLEPCAKSW